MVVNKKARRADMIIESKHQTNMNPKGIDYHFIGIGGAGMNSLAQIIVERGFTVSGSDRAFDQKVSPDLAGKLAELGIILSTQDGSVFDKRDVRQVVVSTSIEDDNPDLKRAGQLGLPILHRAELLAQVSNTSRSIVVAGTSGKTTTTGIIGYVLYYLGLNPTVVNGGVIKNWAETDLIGNAISGHDSNLAVIEADESDGTISLYRPSIGVVLNIALDHKPLSELEPLFNSFAQAVKETLILNLDCARSSELRGSAKITTFGIGSNASRSIKQLELGPSGATFLLEGTSYYVPLLGRHNVSNALAAIAALRATGLSHTEISRALAEFKGIKRRLELIGEKNGVKVFDDYAHNPDKIRASIETLRPFFKRLIVIFQPHGFGPTRLLKEGLISTFETCLDKNDLLYIPDIYYAGGTAARDISSADLIRPLKEKGLSAYYYPQRDEIVKEVAARVQPEDAVIVMGARDNTLSNLCRRLLSVA
ncbi:MAG: Mur ligase domain-containing protein [bacterium]|nr:Mur ligase domain-containing protein [bacterium]